MLQAASGGGTPPRARDLRPLLAAGLTALVSLLLLALAVRFGWLGPDVGRGDDFCETARGGRILQPANTASNVGFVVAGLLIALHAGRPDRLGVALPRYRGLPTAMACLVVLLGPASAAMHATQSAAGGLLDVTSMYLVASFAAAYALLRWYRRSSVYFWQVFSLLVAGCELAGLLGPGVPVVLHLGNVAFGILLVLAIAIEVRLWRRGPERTRLRIGAWSLASMVAAFVIWNLSQHQWCDPQSLLQGHAVWHLLGALSAYLLFRLYASEQVTAPRR